ncbi:MAG: peptidylprolyl isomerase [Acidobacteriota bacterium]|nr:peptidylprolyl isomerase [Acidobacteriota bacterium]
MIIIRTIVFACIAVAALACQQEDVAQTVGPTSSTIAVINGEPIRERQFEDFVSLDPDEPESDSSISRKNILFREMVAEQLVLREADKAGVSVLDEEVQQQLADWFSGGQSVTPALQERVRALLKIQKFIKQEVGDKITISNQEMYNYYRAHEKDFIINDQAHVLELLLDERNQAEEIRSQLIFGDVKTFKNLAQEYSKGLTAESGGDLGMFERGELPEDFEKTIFTLTPGEISPVFRSVEGFHIFMMEEWVQRHAQKFYEVQEVIFDKLITDKERIALDQYMEQLLETVSVEVHDDNLDIKWDESSGKIQ